MKLEGKLSAFSEISQRRATRRPVDLDAKMRELGSSRSDVRIHNLSTHGFMVESDEDFRVDSYVWLTLPGIERLSARVVWRDSFRYGCEFTAPLSAAQLATAMAANEEHKDGDLA